MQFYYFNGASAEINREKSSKDNERPKVVWLSLVNYTVTVHSNPRHSCRISKVPSLSQNMAFGKKASTKLIKKNKL